MIGIRNPKAHDNIAIDEVRAIHFLFIASLLMIKLDEAKVSPVTKEADTTLQKRPIPTKTSAGLRPTTSKDPVREQLLLLIAEHEDTGTNHLMGDTELAEKVGISLREIQKQLEILENLGWVQLAKAMGPSYSARLTAEGLLQVEVLRDKADKLKQIQEAQKNFDQELTKHVDPITGY